jgi:hypothetical protein
MSMLQSLSAAFLILSHASAADPVMWYDKPAADWHEALPLGNGRLGAMVFCGSNGRLHPASKFLAVT